MSKDGGQLTVILRIKASVYPSLSSVVVSSPIVASQTFESETCQILQSFESYMTNMRDVVAVKADVFHQWISSENVVANDFGVVSVEVKMLESGLVLEGSPRNFFDSTIQHVDRLKIVEKRSDGSWNKFDFLVSNVVVTNVAVASVSHAVVRDIADSFRISNENYFSSASVHVVTAIQANRIDSNTKSAENYNRN